jgi:alpha-glucosidase
MTADLKLAGSEVNAFGKDIHDLVLDVEYQSQHSEPFIGRSVSAADTAGLHVHIRDAANKQYQITEELLPRPQSQKTEKRDLEFHFQKDPFAFRVTRPSGEVLFDTLAKSIPKHSDPIKKDGKPVPRSSSEHHPLVFSDQYLQIASALPENANIYGLGETIDSKGLRRNNEGSISTMWSRDAGTPADENIYGTHPFYLETRPGKNGEGSKSHGVFLRNSHGMDILLRKGLIEYRALGGTLDFYFISGPSPKAVVQQYSEIIGKPAQMPFWAFGFHMCRWEGDFSTLERLQKVVDRMRKEDLPLETVWSDLDYMHKKRNFTAGENYP